MSTEIKNGKPVTFNIYTLKLLLFAILSISFTASLSAKNQKGWVIVIDPGHGGYDPGAVGAISYEKNIVLPIALKTGEYIEQNIKDVTVIFTRKTDVPVELKDRAELANKLKADLFISIHANWASSINVRGTETFIMGITKDQQNIEVAMKENEVITREKDFLTKYDNFDPKSPESYIMFALRQNIYVKQSTALASKIQTQYRDEIKRTDRGVKQAGLWVLFMTTMPSVLTETGFITSPTEEKYLNSIEGQDNIAKSISKACKEYFAEIESKSKISVAQETIVENKSDNPVVLQDNGLTFMIQVATSVSKVETNPENFKGLKDIYEFSADGRYKYMTGSFSEYTEAVKYRKTMEKIYPDAFVIAIRDNKLVPLQEALELKRRKNK